MKPPAPLSRLPSAPHQIGFRFGVQCVAQGLWFLVRTPSTWVWAGVPSFVFVSLATGCGLLSMHWLTPWVSGWISAPTSTLEQIQAAALLWSARAVSLVLALVVATILTPILASPALERLIGQQERLLGAPERKPVGMLAEMVCGLKAQTLAVAVLLPAIAIFWAIELAFPPSVVVLVPAKAALLSLGLAWNLLDYPLTLRGIGAKERLRLFRRYPLSALGFGSAVTLLFWFPCCSVFLLPAAVVGACRLVWAIHRAAPGIWPTLVIAPPQAESSEDWARPSA